MFAGPPSSSPLPHGAAAVAAAAAASTHSSTFQLQINSSNGILASKLHGSGTRDVITAAVGNSSAATAGGSGAVKRKRRPAGTPDPDAEVVSLSPRTLLESDRYVCEICNQGFQRDQNLQMHRRRHKVPWKLLKREDASGSGGAGGTSSGAASAKKRVFVCPEPTCLHHDPLHALGDLVGIKKHFRRKHSAHRQWACARCGKAYAVHSDYKAHLKTCGTRGHSCDCGRVFSRVESFIEHQDACHAGRTRGPELQHAPPPVVLPLQQHPISVAAAAVVSACLSRTASSPSPSSDTNFSPGAAAGANTSWPSLHRIPPAITVPTQPAGIAAAFLQRHDSVRSPQTPMMPDSCNMSSSHHQLELQLLPGPVAGTAATSSPLAATPSPRSEEAAAVTNERDTELLLTIGPGDHQHATRSEEVVTNRGALSLLLPAAAAAKLKDEAMEHLRAAEAEKAAADEVRAQARHQIEMAERELANARRFRQQAQKELARAQLLRDHAVRQVNATLLQITCQACKHHFMAAAAAAAAGDAGDVNSLGACSYASASVVTEGEGDNVDDVHRRSGSARAHHAAAAATAARFAKT